MKVLMFGWEYPPHVFGGLATANFGISEGLHAQGDVEITLCLPPALFNAIKFSPLIPIEEFLALNAQEENAITKNNIKDLKKNLCMGTY